MKITREFAEHIAKDFINKMNPNKWDGVGENPSEFDTRICTYDFGSPYVVLDISFDFDDDGVIIVKQQTGQILNCAYLFMGMELILI